MTDKEKLHKMADMILKDLSDRGQVVEGGWRAYELLCGLQNVSSTQRNECRKAFFFGAGHVFTSMITMMEPGTEPTDKDMERMNKLNSELEIFMQPFKKKEE